MTTVQGAEGRVQGVVQIRPNGPGGAGVVLRHEGTNVIVTNAHVVQARPGSVLPVRTWHGRMMEARLQRVDEDRDLAFLATPGDYGMTPAEPGDLATLRPGNLVFAVGHPFGLANALTTGVLQSVGPLRNYVQLPQGKRELSWIQADIRLAPGNSGGPLLDAAGRVIGINTMVVGGLALAVPISEIYRFLTDVIPSERGERGISGLNSQGN